MSTIPANKQNIRRHFDLTFQGLFNGVDGTYSKLVSYQHFPKGLSRWSLNSGILSTAFEYVINKLEGLAE